MAEGGLLAHCFEFAIVVQGRNGFPKVKRTPASSINQ